MADKQRTGVAKQPKDTKSLTKAEAYSCKFCGKTTYYKDTGGAYCAKCYGESKIVTYPLPTYPQPYYPPYQPWQPNIWYSSGAQI